MASTRTYAWRLNDTIWSVAGRFLLESGYSDISAFVAAIQASNVAIIDWQAVQYGVPPTATTAAIPATIIVIPYAI